MLVLHASPHPDDELIGAPATLMALRDAGHEIVNLACSFGRPADAATRRAEVEEACRRAGFELVADVEPVELLRERSFDLVIGPSPHDRRDYKDQLEQLRQMGVGELREIEVQSTYMHGQGLMVPVVGKLSLSTSEGASKGPRALNYSFYRNPRVDDVLVRAAQLSNRVERAKLYQRAQIILVDDLPWLPLYVRLVWGVARPEVQNLRLHPTGLHRLNSVSLEPLPGIQR